MSNYGLNFGFRRSGGDSATREGRFRVPGTGDYRQGDLVTIDNANPGFVKKAPAGAAIVPGVTGLLIQHQGWDASTFEAPQVDSHDLGKARNGVLATIWSGQGIKVWFRNTPAETRFDGRKIAAVTVQDLTGVAMGDDLQWDGAKWVEKTTGAAVLRVLQTDGSAFAESVLQA